MTAPPGISIVIPCLNEAKTIARVVKDAFQALRECGQIGEVIVVDNGSTDETGFCAAQAGACVLPMPERGYGTCLDAGIRSSRFEWVAWLDGDLSYSLKNLTALIDPIRTGQSDVVIGSRFIGDIEHGAMPWLHRRIGTPFLSWLIRQIHGVPTTDTTSGLRAISRTAYLKLSMNSSGMEFGAEILIEAARHEMRYCEIPIEYRCDRRGRPSHLRTYRDGFRFLRTIVAPR